MDPDTIRSLRSWIRKDLLPYCERGSMIPVDLSANCEGRIYYDPNGSGIQILEIRSRDPFSGSTGMSDQAAQDRLLLHCAVVFMTPSEAGVPCPGAERAFESGRCPSAWTAAAARHAIVADINHAPARAVR